MRARALVACLALLAAAPGLADDGSPPPAAAPAQTAPTPAKTERRGPHYRVVCDFASDRAADEALAACESVWQRCVEAFGAPKEIAEPLTMEVHRLPAGYLAAEQKLTAGRFAWNLAFAHRESRTAHVAIQPRIADGAIARAGLPPQTLRLVAHEAVHLARFATAPAAGEHPGWLADGLALWISDEAAREQGWVSAVDEDPTDAERLAAVRRMLADDTLPTAQDLLEDRTGGLAILDRYAARFVFFRHLMGATEGEALRAAINAAFHDTAPDWRKRFDAAVTATLMGRSWDVLDARFVAHVKRVEPLWDETGRGLFTNGDAWMQTAFADEDAVCWRLPLRTPSRIEGTLEPLPSDAAEPAFSVYLAPGGKACVAVTFVPGAKLVRVERVDAKQRTTLAEQTCDALAAPAAYRIEVAATRVLVMVAGEIALEADVPELAAGKGWGLGARAGSTCLWRAIKTTP